MKPAVRAEDNKLTSLVIEGPVLGHWEYSPQLKQRIEQMMRADLQGSLSSIVTAFIEGRPVDRDAVSTKMTSALFTRLLRDYHEINEPIRWVGRVTVRVGNPFPTDGILARGRLVDGFLREVDLAVGPRRPRPPQPRRV